MKNNERILLSRNKREGWYSGKKRVYLGNFDLRRIQSRHMRAGVAEPVGSSLRDWQRYPWRNAKPIPF